MANYTMEAIYLSKKDQSKLSISQQDVIYELLSEFLIISSVCEEWVGKGIGWSYRSHPI